jgi:hypothetical protein
VIDAVAAGRKAATAIDKHLGGEGYIEESLVDVKKPNSWLGREEDFAERNRVQMPCLAVEQRLDNFNDVELGFSSDMAIEEAKRCLQCDLRLYISAVSLPPEKASILEFNSDTTSEIAETEGVIQLLDEAKNVIYIAGTMNLHETLEELVESDETGMEKVRYFIYEENDMYTKKESELIQQYMQEHGSLPELNEDLLF